MAGSLQRIARRLGLSQCRNRLGLRPGLSIERQRVVRTPVSGVEIPQVEQRLAMLRIRSQRITQPLFAFFVPALQLVRVAQIAEQVGILRADL